MVGKNSQIQHIPVAFDEVTGMPTDFQYNSERTSETSSSETQSTIISYTPQLELLQ